MNYCLLEIASPDLPAQIRADIDLALVLDKSGSMEGENKLKNVRKAAEHLTGLLGAGDRISLTVFACRAAEVFPLSPVANKSVYIDRIRNLHTVDVGGTTVMSSGMDIAYHQLLNSDGGNLKRMILLTDGEVTESEDKSRKIAKECRAAGILIRCIGVGGDWNWHLLNDLDWKHEAEYIKQNEIALIPDRFSKEFETLANTYGSDALLEFSFINGVAIHKCTRFHPRISPVDHEPGSANYRLGSLSGGTKEYIILELMLPPRSAEGTYNIGRVSLRYKDTATGSIETTPPQTIRISYTHDGILASMVNPEVQNYVKRLATYSMVDKATGLLNAGEISKGTSLLQKAAQLTGVLGDSNLQNMLTGVLAGVQKTGLLTPEQQKELLSGSRKTSMLNPNS
jgi:Ca-activated chloride channel family protein